MNRCAITRVLLTCCLYLFTQPVLSENNAAPESLRFNEFQYLGSHNSYKKEIDPTLLRVIGWTNEAAALELDYHHESLEKQLDIGMRNLELDIYHDPRGGHYLKPIGRWFGKGLSDEAQLLMEKPGFKVLHTQDVDYQSHCHTFRICLAQIKTWSEKHPKHFPITIVINAKTETIEVPRSLPPFQFDDEAWDLVDEDLRTLLGDRLFTPGILRGDAESLHQALQQGWPKVTEMRGKILFLLDDDMPKKLSYIKRRGLAAAMFADLPATHSEAAIMVMNEPIRQQAEITALVKRGFVVRTRADAGTIEARENDTQRREAAFDSGAQIITTDYYYADPRFEGGYRVALPETAIAKCNPQLVALQCILDQ